MLFNVPQFIDVEDKVAGPFTAKQLFWMFGMGAVLFVMYVFLESTPFFVASVPVILIFVAFAFWKPYNQPLIFIVFSGILFLFRPKLYTWHRRTQTIPTGPKRPLEKKKEEEKKLSADDIAALAQTLDSSGIRRSEKIEELIQQHTKKPKRSLLP